MSRNQKSVEAYADKPQATKPDKYDTDMTLSDVKIPMATLKLGSKRELRLEGFSNARKNRFCS